jgi:hypothetical protein
MFWSDLLGKRETQGFVPAVAAITATFNAVLFAAPQKCRVSQVDFVPQAAVSGSDSTTKNLNIVFRNGDGSGSTEVGNLDLPAAVTLTAMDLKNIPLNSTYLVPGVEMEAGDVLALQFEEVSTGVAIPDLMTLVTWEPAAA